MKKTILVTALLMTIFSFGQTFEKAIISQNTHIYNPVKNLECRMIRAITPHNGVHFSDEGVTVYVQVLFRSGAPSALGDASRAARLGRSAGHCAERPDARGKGRS